MNTARKTREGRGGVQKGGGGEGDDQLRRKGGKEDLTHASTRGRSFVSSWTQGEQKIGRNGIPSVNLHSWEIR